MAEWLGSALQKLLQRFESASDLHPEVTPSMCLGFFCAQIEGRSGDFGKDLVKGLLRNLSVFHFELNESAPTLSLCQ